MLIIPLSDKPKRRFPYITVLLILLHIGIFFYFQHSKQQKYMQAVSLARSSGLLQIEQQAYLEYLQRHHRTIPALLQDTQKPAAIFQHLMQDDQFQAGLRQHILIPPADPRFADWSPKRKAFEEKLNQSLVYRFGYSPARKNYLSITTYMFFHDDLLLLVANMLFLWFVGSWIEIDIGRILFLGIYLVTGAFAGLSFGFMYPLSQGPLLGASGAIAGLMGTYLLIYCNKKINVLCSLGFCSRYTMVFGWFLFPFWLSKEVYLFVNTSTPQTSSSHIGGLLAGLVVGLIFRTHEGKQAAKKAQKERDSETGVGVQIQPSLVSDQDIKMLGKLSPKEAEQLRTEIQKALQDDPDNLVELARLFHLDKCNPTGDQFHKTAGKLLGQLAEQENFQDLYTYFYKYKKISATPRLQPSVMLALAEIHIRSDQTTEAAHFLLLLLKKRPQYPGLPSCLFALAMAYREQNNEKRATQCFQLICKKYPQTIICQQAEDMLTMPHNIAV
ncbi:MAG: rhomboid family intramembrane serine protease [Candidatus Electrothrix sp. AU1_5]|nr:rhomboid family intramembrane serine protease [Candidatus Electrothrix gigas]